VSLVLGRAGDRLAGPHVDAAAHEQRGREDEREHGGEPGEARERAHAATASA
jgi:hypothetical protein